ncbi:hypothetical protein [Streptobacillus moniliformis]|uniref:hypothetical protein n=1 Tax=Streptobacillus moniliformis TaxID=34105 RepID=UPI0001A38BEA|nr:hypothetical protein [Streptobacillus moniliformis]QXW65239.1 hypothetical protein KX935_05320 [Streptobacillus moniliformis]
MKKITLFDLTALFFIVIIHVIIMPMFIHLWYINVAILYSMFAVYYFIIKKIKH